MGFFDFFEQFFIIGFQLQVFQKGDRAALEFFPEITGRLHGPFLEHRVCLG